MRDGATKFVVGTVIGAVGGFALGSAVSTPAARSAGQTLFSGMETTARLTGHAAMATTREMTRTLRYGYTRVRGREAYLEHEIAELRDKISDLEDRLD